MTNSLCGVSNLNPNEFVRGKTHARNARPRALWFRFRSKQVRTQMTMPADVKIQKLLKYVRDMFCLYSNEFTCDKPSPHVATLFTSHFRFRSKRSCPWEKHNESARYLNHCIVISIYIQTHVAKFNPARLHARISSTSLWGNNVLRHGHTPKRMWLCKAKFQQVARLCEPTSVCKTARRLLVYNIPA